MRKVELIMLILRLLGVYFIINGISESSHVVAYMVKSTFTQAFYEYAVGPLLYILSGAVLFVKTPLLGKFIFDFSQSGDDAVAITNYEKTARISLLLLGIYLFVDTVPIFAQTLIDAKYLYALSDTFTIYPTYLIEWTAFILGPVITIVVCALMILWPDKAIYHLSKYDPGQSPPDQIASVDKAADEDQAFQKALKISLLVMGLYIFTIFLPDFLESFTFIIYQFLLRNDNQASYMTLSFFETIGTMVASSINLLIAVMLIFGFDKVVSNLSRHDVIMKKLSVSIESIKGDKL